MYYLITYSSATYALRIKNYFSRRKGNVGIIRTPCELAKGGCSYSVKVKAHMVDEVLQASEEMGFKSSGVFKQTEDGSYSEVMAR